MGLEVWRYVDIIFFDADDDLDCCNTAVTERTYIDDNELDFWTEGTTRLIKD